MNDIFHRPDPLASAQESRPLDWKDKLRNLALRPWFIILSTFLIISLLGIISVNDIMKALLHSRPEVVVPELEKTSLLNALGVVSDLELAMIQDGTEFDESLPAGTIIRQHPPAGMQVRAGRAIRVIISKGGQVVFVPDVMGRPLAEAQSQLAQEGLQLGAVIEIFSADFPNSTAITLDPSSGTVVTRGALIDLTISKGPPPVGIPIVLDFHGQMVDDVRAWGQENEVKVKVIEDPEAVGRAGSVVRQDPIADQPIIDKELHVTIVPILASEQGFRFTYRIPAEYDEVRVRIKARANRGEFEVYRGVHKGGERIEVPMSIESTTRARIYLNDHLQQERVIEP